MLHPAKAGVAGAAREAIRELRRMSRPSGGFDASRYFRGADDLGFYNVGTTAMRGLARSIVERHPDWTLGDAMAFAGMLIMDRHLEAKSIGIEAVARFHRGFTPPLLTQWKRWLAQNHSANWATTDAICGQLVGPLLVRHPAAAARLRPWARHRNLWVRRASIVGLIALARRGLALDQLYGAARILHPDRADLIHKAVGWALREAGKTDPPRLERYLLANGPRIPRTTLRYAIERFPPSTRRRLMRETRDRG